jgi:hypothetical protein
MLREVMAGATGFVIFVASSALLFAVSGYDPYREVSMTFQLISIAAGVVFALFAGYVTAALSPASPVRPVVLVALLIAVLAIGSLLATGSGEAWSQLAALLLMAPAVLLGGRRRIRQMRDATMLEPIKLREVK